MVDHPTWSSDGRYLTWSSISDDGQHSLVTWDSTSSDLLPKYSGQGDWPIWGGKGEILFTSINTPHESFLTAYPRIQENTQVMLPAIKLPGSLEGISWARELTMNPSIVSDQDVDPVFLWEDLSYFNGQEMPQEDLTLVHNLTAPNPRFIEPAANAFNTLRLITRQDIGWDFLATLDYAFVPLNETLEPGINFNWLFAGRGMLINDIPRMAEWLMVVQEDFGENTYWRIYLKTNNQQGLQGKPLKRYPWDFSAKHSGSNEAYEKGGERSAFIPAGYWVDFTQLASTYGWIRFPAKPYWQYSETATRYQYFAFTQGLSLETALKQLYSQAEIQSLLSSSNY